MNGEILQEYLVSLGVETDKAGFAEMQRTLGQATNVVQRATAAWAANFAKAAGIIAGAIGGVTSAVGGLMNAAANEDLAMQKLGNRMLITAEQARTMKKATDALGESVQDIILTPELTAAFRQLTAEGRQMAIGGDYKEIAKDFRDLTFEIVRLKQEASYAMTWVGYYLMKYLQKPLAEIRTRFKNFNDTFIKNISVWTEKIARGMVYIVNIGRHFLDFIFKVGEAVWNVWDSFPKGVKIALGAFTALWAVLRMNPLVRTITLIGGLMLLIDDYFGYMEGKDAALGKYWDKLNEYIEIAKVKWKEYSEVLMAKWEEWSQVAKDKWEEYSVILKRKWEDFKEWASEAYDTVIRYAKELYVWVGNNLQAFKKWFDELASSDEVQEFIKVTGELIDALADLFDALWELTTIALKALFEGFDDTKHAYTFGDAIREVSKFINMMIKALTVCTKAVTNFLKEMRDNETFKNFWYGIGEAVSFFINLVKEAIGMTGKLGQALLMLVDGQYGSSLTDRLKAAGDFVMGAIGDFGASVFAGSETKGLTAKELLWEPLVQKYAKEYGVDPTLVRAVIKQESGFNPNAVSSAGAQGLMQLMPGTAGEMGVTNPFDPEQNIMGGAKYLRKMLDYFHGDIEKAVSAYNAGPGGNFNNAETRNYKKRVLGFLSDYRSRTVKKPEASSLAGDAIATNALSYKVGYKWMGRATKDKTKQCDSFTAHIYNESGIPSIGGHSTDNKRGNVINDIAFKAAGAWHESDKYKPQNGDIVGWNWSPTSGHYGIYANGKVVTRDSKGGIQQRTLDEAITLWGNPTGYGSIAEAEAKRKKAKTLPTAYTNAKYSIQNLLANAQTSPFVNGLLQGGNMPAYGMGKNYSFSSGDINVGGITVYVQGGVNATAKEVGNEVARRLWERGEILQKIRALDEGMIANMTTLA